LIGGVSGALLLAGAAIAGSPAEPAKKAVGKLVGAYTDLRARFKSSRADRVSCDASGEHADAGDMGEGCGACDGFLPILGKTAASIEPCECSLDGLNKKIRIHRNKPAGRPMSRATAKANAGKSMVRCHVDNSTGEWGALQDSNLQPDRYERSGLQGKAKWNQRRKSTCGQCRVQNRGPGRTRTCNESVMSTRLCH
jgi:hypothetical protein